MTYTYVILEVSRPAYDEIKQKLAAAGYSDQFHDEGSDFGVVIDMHGLALAVEEEKKVPTPIMKYFEYKHLPEHLQPISGSVASVAQYMDETLPDGPEKSAGLRKLLEAKDCFVRAKLG